MTDYVGDAYVEYKLGMERNWLLSSARRSHVTSWPLMRRADAIKQYLVNGIEPMTTDEIARVLYALCTAHLVPPISSPEVVATWEPAERATVGDLTAAWFQKGGAKLPPDIPEIECAGLFADEDGNVTGC